MFGVVNCFTPDNNDKNRECLCWTAVTLWVYRTSTERQLFSQITFGKHFLEWNFKRCHFAVKRIVHLAPVTLRAHMHMHMLIAEMQGKFLKQGEQYTVYLKDLKFLIDSM